MSFKSSISIAHEYVWWSVKVCVCLSTGVNRGMKFHLLKSQIFLCCVCVCSFLGRYASIQAIESPSKEDEQQWLTYWVLYSFITLFEVAAAPVLFWYTTYPQKLPPSSSSEALQWDPDPGFQMQTCIKEKQPLGWAHEHFIWRTMRSLHLSSLDWLVSHITWFLGKDSAENLCGLLSITFKAAKCAKKKSWTCEWL